MTERVLLYEEALAEVLAAAALLPEPATERVPLSEARGRVLAAPVLADRDQPPFRRSTRDGYAVRAADVSGAEAGGARSLRLIGTLRAGEAWAGAPLASGEAIEIMTGAPVPEGADAVLMVEHAALHGTQLQPEPGRRLQMGENIVPRGAEALAGGLLVPAGRLLDAPELAVAASCGYAELAVYARPRVAILATGDELVELGEQPADWQIRNSNSYALAALVEAEGGTPWQMPTARDTLDDLRQRLTAVRTGAGSASLADAESNESGGADLLVLSGGVSKGKYDLVEQVLHEAGAEFVFTGARIQPGRPVVFGRLPRSAADAGSRQHPDAWIPFFGLPGNPISTEVCFRLFVAPLLRALCGGKAVSPRFAEARLAETVRGGAKVTRFLPAEISGDWQGVTVRPVPWQGSGDLAANARANGFVVVPMDAAALAPEDTVRVLLR